MRVKIPIQQNSSIDISMYNEFKNQGINLYDSEDPIYTSRCITFKNKTNGYDTTLNSRRLNLYPNRSVICNANCTFQGFDENNYVQCDCSG
jgi:hypothetical protein